MENTNNNVPSPNYNFSLISMVNVANFVSTKLIDDPSSYILWKAQIICLLQSQDLLGFIDGTIPSPTASTAVDVVAAAAAEWKRVDCFVKGWIFSSLTENVLANVVHSATSRDVWLVLEELYSTPSSQDDSIKLAKTIESEKASAESIESEKGYNYYLPLYRALLSEDWKKAEEFLKGDKQATKDQINSILETPLHVAVTIKNAKSKHLVQKLVDNMDNEDLAIRDSAGRTALHVAALFGNLDAAKILVSRNPNLPHISDLKGRYPIHNVTELGYITEELFLYFLSVTTDPAPYTGLRGFRLLALLIQSHSYDFARQLVEKNPDLATYFSKEHGSLLWVLSTKEFAFLSGSRLNIWQQLVYYCIPIKSTSKSPLISNDIENAVQDSQTLQSKDLRVQCTTVIKRLYVLLFDVLEKGVPLLKQIRDKKSIHHNAVKFAEYLCKKIECLNDMEVKSIITDPLVKATRNGTYELIEIIVRTFPYTPYIHNRDQKNILHVSIENRCENVFNMIMSQHTHRTLMLGIDSSRNNMLHLAGKLAPQNKLNRVSGPALQMQRELQWFKEVTKFAPPDYMELENNDGKPPHVVFTEEHGNLKTEGEKWMKDTSSSCTIAAALIATIAFAAAITVPGGNRGETGLPMFSGNNVFIIFAISNAASLFTSTTSLLVFLSILTSRYAEEDFLLALPRSLILGLLTLFLSITFMMVSFSVTVYLVFGQNKAWVLVPIATMACLPITSFVLLQFPLLFSLISSTYGPGIFARKTTPLFSPQNNANS